MYTFGNGDAARPVHMEPPIVDLIQPEWAKVYWENPRSIPAEGTP
ncbi:MAG TPA: hypothetical protein VJT10_10715 [Steroidobacteraceae bacterium]|nr:hypothetical protein [Steroidobacteraceae bacterium]